MLDAQRETAAATAASQDPSAEAPAPSRLARVLARHCHGRTLASTAALHGDQAAFTRRRRQLTELDLEWCTEALLTQPQGSENRAAPSADQPSPQTFDTVLALHLLERLNKHDRERVLHGLWQRLNPRGRLIVCVPNENCGGVPRRETPTFSRRQLRSLLKGLGQPKLIKEQPFKWLAMYVDKEPAVSRSVQERYRVIADLCRGRVIELGCGPGELCATIAARGLPVIGVDKNTEKIAGARRRYPRIEFFCADILSLSLARGAYDTVILSEVLEHVTAAPGDRMLIQAWALLKPGGRLLVSVPNEDCVPHPNHRRLFDQKSLQNLLSRWGRPVPVTEQPYKYLLMYVEKSLAGDLPALSRSGSSSGPQ